MAMDNLKTLMDKRHYELVIKLTENATDATTLFYRISAQLGSGKAEDALNCINTNQKTLESNMSLLIKVHLEVLCLLGRFDEAFAVLDYYKNRPYVSQEVEELLRDMPKMIRLEEQKHNSMRFIKDEDLIRKFESQDPDDILMVIDIVRERDINKFLNYIQNVMINFPKQSIRSLMLLLLVQKQINRSFSFNHIGEIITVNPSFIEPPFVGDTFNQIIKELELAYRNPVLSENAISILSTHLIYIYPQSMNIETQVLIEALYQIANEYLNNDVKDSLEGRCQEKSIDVSEVNSLIVDIKKSLDNF